MTLWELLDRMGERRAKKVRRPYDVRVFVGMLFLAGYYWMVYQFTRRALPAENLDLIRDAMLTLGPPVGIIVGAMFRTDVRDLQAAENTGLGFKAVTAAAQAGTVGEPDRAAGKAADAVADAAADKASEIKSDG